MKIVLNVTKKPFKFQWKFCLCRHAWINQWFHNNSWLLWWPVSLSMGIQSTLNHIRLFFTTTSKITTGIYKICWQLKTLTRLESAHAYLYASDFPLKKLLQIVVKFNLPLLHLADFSHFTFAVCNSELCGVFFIPRNGIFFH